MESESGGISPNELTLIESRTLPNAKGFLPRRGKHNDSKAACLQVTKRSERKHLNKKSNGARL
jgi:hypothetical protein